MIRPNVDIVVSPDHVMVFGRRVPKPVGLSVVEWLRFWERVQKLKEPFDFEPSGN